MALKPVGINDDGSFVGRAADWLSATFGEQIGEEGTPANQAVIEVIGNTVPPIPPGVITSTQVARMVAVPEGDDLPVLQDGDLVIRYTLPGNLYSLDFTGETHNAAVTNLDKVSGTDWLVWDSDPDVPGAVNDKVLRLSGSGSFYAIPELEDDEYKANAEVLVRYRHSGTGRHGPHFYFFGDASYTDGLYVAYTILSSNGFARVRSKSGGTHTDLATGSVALLGVEWAMMRARCYGNTLYLKIWADGDPEPAEWSVSTTVSTSLAKRFAIGRVSDQAYQYIDWIAVATGGKTAVAP